MTVTAAPKFIALQQDAKAAAVLAVVGALNSVITISHCKALTKNQGGATSNIELNGADTDLVHGYIAANVNLTTLLDIDSAMGASFITDVGGWRGECPYGADISTIILRV